MDGFQGLEGLEGVELQRVIDLCEAFADFIAADPVRAAQTARKLADVLRVTDTVLDAATAKAVARSVPVPVPAV